MGIMTTLTKNLPQKGGIPWPGSGRRPRRSRCVCSLTYGLQTGDDATLSTAYARCSCHGRPRQTAGHG